ncbi:MAG: glycoside hydrolase family 78 protein [Clostridiales bacterium]|nr:glycoside hydrolase family 78 protein [Clostridiales bacterium]
MKIQNVTCEFMTEPLAVTTEHPRFSWELASEEAGIRQSSWQIVVKDNDGTTVWDSGKNVGENSIGIPYQGETLRSAIRYEYQITAENSQGQTVVSEPQYFETAFYHLEDWKARWIEPDPLPQLPENPLIAAQKEWDDIVAAMMRGEQAEPRYEGDIMGEKPYEPFDPAVIMRRSFSVDQTLRARLYVTAHGIYEVKINGKPVTDSLFNPGFTTYDKRIKYQVFDVDALIQQGENVIAVTVADGWYKGKVTSLGRGCDYGEVPGLLLQLEITDGDGKKTIICTDEEWKYSYDGPVRTADLFVGETVDGRMEAPAEIKWKPVIVKESPDEAVEAQCYPFAKVYAEIPAKKVWTAPNGDTLVDFGQNMAGVLRVTEIKGTPGERIVFEHGEELDKDGNFFYSQAHTSAKQMDTYICRGIPEKAANATAGELFEPHFTYHGFRYVRVTGGRDWTKEQFTALAVSTENALTGSFRCSDPDITRLQQNIYWSQLSNNVTIPTDCPTREKAGWTGDVVVYGATALYNQNMTAFYEDWLKSIRAEQREDGHILNTVPQNRSYVSQSGCGSLGWGDVILTLPWQLYELYGDTKVLADNYEAMGKWMKAMQAAAWEMPDAFNTLGMPFPDYEKLSERQKDNQHYLINTGFHFGDWIIPSVVDENGFTDGSGSAIRTMYYADTGILAGDADLYASVSELLGQEETAREYRAYANRVREAFSEEYVSENGRLGQEMQGNYILALKYHMVPKEKEPLLAARLSELIAENGYCLDTGFMSTPHLLDVLCDYGYQETAWKVLMQRKAPSWLYEIDHGATTLWENWDAIREDGEQHNCSFNHYAFGCVGDFLYRRVLGIQNAGIGYDKIRIHPEYSCPFTWAEGSYHSAHGEICVRWEKTETGIKISGCIPANTEAELLLPDGTKKRLLSGAFAVCR